MKTGKMEKTAALMLGISIFFVSSGGTCAYMNSRTQSLVNTVTTGSVALTLTETQWRPEEARALLPGSTVAKNPTVKNTGKSDAWMFLRVLVPQKEIRLVDPATKRKTEAKKTELLTFEALAEWELLERTENGEEAEYVYGYRQRLAPGEESGPLFKEVTLADYLEGELSGQKLTLSVHAIAVQDGLCAEGAGLKELYQTWCARESST